MFDWFTKLIGYLSLSHHHEWLGRPITLIYFLVVSSAFLISLVRLILFREQIMVSSVFFNAVSPVQYILGVRYMMGTHLQSVLRDCRRSLIKLPTKAKLFGFIVAAAVTGLINLILIVTLSQDNQKIPKSFEMLLSVMNQNVVYAWLFIYWITAGLIQATNLVLFALVFHKHLQDIANLKDHLESDVIWKMNQESFIDLTRQIIGLRYVINQSVDNLESFYTSFTILGAIAIGPILELKQVTPYLMYYSIVYCLTQTLFVYYIYFISKNREDILKVVKSPMVMFKYLTNVKSMKNVDVLRQEMAELRKLDPSRFHTINKYKIAAYSPRTSYVSTEQEMEEGLLKKEREDDVILEEMENKRPQVDLRKRMMNMIMEDKVEQSEMSQVESELLAISYKNNAAIDWMILHEVLQEKWASFSLMGLSFDDSDVIKKSVGMTSAIILVSSYINSLSLI